MAYDPLEIAAFLQEKALAEGGEINLMKLQKLIYYAHGWHLAIHHAPLITMPVKAWEYGPVVPEVYHRFKHYGERPISEPLGAPCLDRETQALLDVIWARYGAFTGVQLANMTHAPDSPWRNALEASPYHCGMDIPDEAMRDYFVHLASKPS